MKKPKVLVTGSAGLIGSSIVDVLMERGYPVYGLDNLSTCPMDNVPEAARKNFFQSDLRNKQNAELIMRMVKPEVVVHAAAWAHEGLAQYSPRLITENNINVFLNTIIPAIRTGMKRFVFFSSIAVYGGQEPPFTEDTPKKPEDIYGANKAFIEDAIEVLSKVHGFEYTILRCYNVFGERQSMTDPYRGVVAIFMNQVLHGKPLTIFGDGEQKRSLTYIRDIIPAIVDSAFAPKAANQIFNIGDDRVYTINDLVSAIGKAAGKKVETIHLADRAQEVKVAYCDNSKARKILGLKTETPFDKAIKQTWDVAASGGPKEGKYLDYFELPSDKIPKNWRNHGKEDK